MNMYLADAIMIVYKPVTSVSRRASGYGRVPSAAAFALSTLSLNKTFVPLIRRVGSFLTVFLTLKINSLIQKESPS